MVSMPKKRNDKYTKDDIWSMFADLFDHLDSDGTIKFNTESYNILLWLAKKNGFDYDKEMECYRL